MEGTQREEETLNMQEVNDRLMMAMLTMCEFHLCHKNICFCQTFIETDPVFTEEGTLNVQEVIDRLMMATLTITELQLSNKKMCLKHGLYQVDLLSARIRSTHPKQVNSTLINETMKELIRHQNAEKFLTTDVKTIRSYLWRFPLTPGEYILLLRFTQEKAVKKGIIQDFLDTVAEYKDIQKTLWTVQQARDMVDARWRVEDRTAQLSELDAELLYLEMIICLPEFEQQLLKARLEMTENYPAIRMLCEDCYHVLGDCDTRLQCIRRSLESLIDYVDKKWRKMERTESPTATAGVHGSRENDSKKGPSPETTHTDPVAQ